MIDIILQVTNFSDPRSSGLICSVKFGYEEDITSETQLSTNLQLITGVICMLHAIFAGLIYVVGIRDKRLLNFALAIVLLAFINLTGGDEKVFYQYVDVGYTTSFKLAMFVMFLLSWSILKAVGPQIETISKKILPIYTILCGLLMMISAFLPMEYLAFASWFTFSAVFIGVSIATIALIRSWRHIQGGIWISLSMVGIASHYFWWAYTMGSGLKVIYYPFDLIIAIICLAGVWFKHYHEMYIETENLAVRLQEEDKAKDEFLANTSHELRNPLYSILNLSEAVLKREKSSIDKESINNLESVLSVSRHMSFMLDELLEMAILKDGKPRLNIQPVSLQATTKGVIDLLQYMLDGKPVQIMNHIPNDFPMVNADENRTIQIIFNLLHNAIKYTSKGKITIKAKEERESAVISVVDTGIGMDQETIDVIFEPYIQGTNEDSILEGGFGLGLNITKN